MGTKGKVNDVALEQELMDFERIGMCIFLPRGWERYALEQRVATGELVRPMPGMYARRTYWDGLSREQKMLHVIKTESVTHPSWVFSHASAALVHGIDVSGELFWPVHYATARTGGGKSAHNFRHHRSTHGSSVRVNDVRVTPIAQTVIDCAREHPFRYALAIADSALHLGLVDANDLSAELSAQAGARGILQARRVASLCDARPESGGESIVRAIMIELNLPVPQLQVPFDDPFEPGRPYRVDFLFTLGDGRRVAFELDGLEKYRNPRMTNGRGVVEVMARERQREARLTAHGLAIVRMGFREASDPQALLTRLAAYGVVRQADGSCA